MRMIAVVVLSALVSAAAGQRAVHVEGDPVADREFGRPISISMNARGGLAFSVAAVGDRPSGIVGPNAVAILGRESWAGPLRIEREPQIIGGFSQTAFAASVALTEDDLFYLTKGLSTFLHVWRDDTRILQTGDAVSNRPGASFGSSSELLSKPGDGLWLWMTPQPRPGGLALGSVSRWSDGGGLEIIAEALDTAEDPLAGPIPFRLAGSSYLFDRWWNGAGDQWIASAFIEDLGTNWMLIGPDGVFSVDGEPIRTPLEIGPSLTPDIGATWFRVATTKCNSHGDWIALVLGTDRMRIVYNGQEVLSEGQVVQTPRGPRSLVTGTIWRLEVNEQGDWAAIVGTSASGERVLIVNGEVVAITGTDADRTGDGVAESDTRLTDLGSGFPNSTVLSDRIGSRIVLTTVTTLRVGNAERFAIHEFETLAPGACSAVDLSGAQTPGIPDGTLTGADFFRFLSLFGDGDLQADLAGAGGTGPPDGRLTGGDFFAFLAAFSAGCG